LQEVSAVTHYPSDLILIHIQGPRSKTLVSIICCTADCIWIDLYEENQIWFKSQAPSVSMGFMPVYKGLNFILCVWLESYSYSQWSQLGYHQGFWGRTLYSRCYFTHHKPTLRKCKQEDKESSNLSNFPLSLLLIKTK